MKILCHPQPSMRSYRDGTWLISKDSQINRLADWIEALPSDWEWSVLLPLEDQMDKEWSKRFRGVGNVDIVNIWWPDNVMLSRYYFPMNVADAMLSEDFDLLFLEVPELAGNWKALMKMRQKEMRQKEIPIASLCIHLDDAYTIRQWDGYESSDLFAFQLEGTAADFSERVGFKMGVKPQRWKVWPALFSSAEIENHWIAPYMDIPAINFTARLSDDGRTHYKAFFEAIRILETKREDFQVWVMNPNEAYPPKQVYKQSKMISFVGDALLRERYLQMLWQSSIVPVLWPQDRIHARSFCEAIASNNSVLMHDMKEWPGWSLTGPVEPEAVAAALGLMLDQIHAGGEKLAEHFEMQIDWLESDRGVDQNIWKVQRDLEDLVV